MGPLGKFFEELVDVHVLHAVLKVFLFLLVSLRLLVLAPAEVHVRMVVVASFFAAFRRVLSPVSSSRMSATIVSFASTPTAPYTTRTA
mgnify:CR=1 FL=1